MPEPVIKLYSPWHQRDLNYGGVRFSPSVNLEEADGALWEYNVSPDIIEYNGPKAWYFWEPSWHSMRRSKLAKTLNNARQPESLLWYGQMDTAWRVPHITHIGGLDVVANENRTEKAVAIVSNFGGYSPYQRVRVRLRNKFILNRRVDLYGRKSNWSRYFQIGFWPKFGCPRNYQGELDWKDSWMSDEQPRFLSRYKVAICLENSVEPYYFTEKFVNAVRGGCIPVYHAHPTIADGILRGARWIDPRDYDYNVDATIDKALSTEIKEVQSENQRWLQSEAVKQTSFDGVWTSIGQIFQHKIKSCLTL